MKVILQVVGHIDNVEVFEYSGFRFVDNSQIPEEERIYYEKWLRGQTRPLLDFCPDSSFYQDYAMFHTAYKNGQKNPHVYD